MKKEQEPAEAKTKKLLEMAKTIMDILLTGAKFISLFL